MEGAAARPLDPAAGRDWCRRGNGAHTIETGTCTTGTGGGTIKAGGCSGGCSAGAAPGICHTRICFWVETVTCRGISPRRGGRGGRNGHRPAAAGSAASEPRAAAEDLAEEGTSSSSWSSSSTKTLWPPQVPGTGQAMPNAPGEAPPDRRATRRRSRASQCRLTADRRGQGKGSRSPRDLHSRTPRTCQRSQPLPGPGDQPAAPIQRADPGQRKKQGTTAPPRSPTAPILPGSQRVTNIFPRRRPRPRRHVSTRAGRRHTRRDLSGRNQHRSRLPAVRRRGHRGRERRRVASTPIPKRAKRSTVRTAS